MNVTNGLLDDDGDDDAGAIDADARETSENFLLSTLTATGGGISIEEFLTFSASLLTTTVDDAPAS